MPFTAEWTGGPGQDDIIIRPTVPGAPVLAVSHFGSGVMTFQINGVFRTEPGFDIMLTGPLNLPKDAIAPLAGVIETDWIPSSFTMNWKFTRPGVPVRFERDEPFAMMFPVKRGLVEEQEPEILPIEQSPEVEHAFRAWSASRAGFIEELKVVGSEAQTQRWQKDYFQGSRRFGVPPPDHRTKLRPRAFTGLHRWREGGLMDQIVHHTLETDAAARARLRDGVLAPTPNTVRLTPDMAIEPDALDFVFEPNFLTAAECAILKAATLALSCADPDQPVPFAAIARDQPEAADLIRSLRRRVAERLTGVYELLLPIYADSAHLVRLTEGTFLDSEAVRAHADGSEHPLAFRDFASLIFLDDDCEGGEIYFPRLDLVVKPGAGMLLAFTAGWGHEHGMTEIVSGEQLSLPMFHTFTAHMAESGLHAPPASPREPPVPATGDASGTAVDARPKG